MAPLWSLYLIPAPKTSACLNSLSKAKCITRILGNCVHCDHHAACTVTRRSEERRQAWRWQEGEERRGRSVERRLRGKLQTWWAPNEQIMTGSILQDGGQPPPTPDSSLPSPYLDSLPAPPFALPIPLLLSSPISDSSISPLLPPCSCLLIVSEALSLGPPTRLRSEGIAASQGGDWNVKMLSETASTRREGGHTREAAPAVSWPEWAEGDLQNGASEVSFTRSNGKK